MSTKHQISTTAKKCLRRLNNGNACPSDALEGTSYCSEHGPKESGESSGGTFGTSAVLYSYKPPDKIGE